MIHMSAKEYQEMLKKQPKGHKHHNRFVYVYEDGFVAEQKDLTRHGKVIRKYDSKKEYARHKQIGADGAGRVNFRSKVAGTNAHSRRV